MGRKGNKGSVLTKITVLSVWSCTTSKQSVSQIKNVYDIITNLLKYKQRWRGSINRRKQQLPKGILNVGMYESNYLFQIMELISS